MNPPRYAESRALRLLDLFGGDQGAAEGYRRAGFDVVSVDNDPARKGPGPSVVADALDYLRDHWQGFDAVHASPPCRDHTDLAARVGVDGSGWLLSATLDALSALPLPWVVENVESAPMPGALTLCGAEFDLSVICRDGRRRWLRRHRRFASNVFLMGAGGCACRGRRIIGVYGHDGGQETRGYKANLAEAREVMGMPWASRQGVSLAIPPTYTRFIGEQLLTAVGVAA